MSINDYGDRIMLIYFTIGWAAPEMFIFHISDEKIIPFDYDKEGSEMTFEPKWIVVWDDAAAMLLAFPGINYMSLT